MKRNVTSGLHSQSVSKSRFDRGTRPRAHRQGRALTVAWSVAACQWCPRPVRSLRCVTYTWHDIDGRMAELCDECGFDARELSGSQDEERRLVAAYAALEALLQHADADRRPAPETWSAREYVAHCLDVAPVILGWIAELTTRKPLPELADLENCRGAVTSMLPLLTDEQRHAVLHDQYRQPVAVEWLVRHLLHDTEHHVLDLRRGYAVLAMADYPEVPFRG